jgi:hypothetical protein
MKVHRNVNVKWSTTRVSTGTFFVSFHFHSFLLHCTRRNYESTTSRSSTTSVIYSTNLTSNHRHHLESSQISSSNFLEEKNCKIYICTSSRHLSLPFSYFGLSKNKSRGVDLHTELLIENRNYARQHDADSSAVPQKTSIKQRG